jgi:hypothetical protein
LCNLSLCIKPLTALARKNISKINPDLDTNNTKSRMGFSTVIIDIGTQSLQRNFALYLFLCTRNFCTAQASRNDYFDALSIGTHRLLYGLLHSTTEGDTTLQLFRNATGDQIGIQLRLTNLDNVHTDTFLGLRL